MDAHARDGRSSDDRRFEIDESKLKNHRLQRPTLGWRCCQVGGAGVKHFVPKPYTAETLLKILAEALRE